LKQILIISGKGGTGKTSFTAAFAALSENAVFCDCDVDAADLHLILKPQISKESVFVSGHKAVTDYNQCISCGICNDLCRFDAVTEKDGKYYIDSLKCEGCGVCVWNCPSQAIELTDYEAGHCYISSTRYGMMSHAKLYPGAENSGKLVTKVRQNAVKLAEENKADLIIIDGPPGIGCPVIASITGTDAVLVVTEPTVSGISDLERVVKLTKNFGVKTYVAINKYDINRELTDKITREYGSMGYEIIGIIPYDKKFVKAQLEGKSIVEYGECEASDEIKKIFKIITN